jgi:acyl-CoA thioesterase-2
VAGPAGLADLEDRFRDDPAIPPWWRVARPVRFRHVEPPPYVAPEAVADRQSVHVRSAGPLPDDPVVRAAVAAYVTDMSLLEPAFRALGAARHAPGSRILSLTHSLTFHREPDLSTWHQFDCRVGAVAHGRALGSGELFDDRGRHVLTAGQLGLVKAMTG